MTKKMKIEFDVAWDESCETLDDVLAEVKSKFGADSKVLEMNGRLVGGL